MDFQKQTQSQPRKEAVICKNTGHWSNIENTKIAVEEVNIMLQKQILMGTLLTAQEGSGLLQRIKAKITGKRDKRVLYTAYIHSCRRTKI